MLLKKQLYKKYFCLVQYVQFNILFISFVKLNSVPFDLFLPLYTN